MEWIKCSDEMPEIGRHVLFFISVQLKSKDDFYFQQIEKGFLSDSCCLPSPKWLSYEDWYNLDNVTHWMPLPNPPKST